MAFINQRIRYCLQKIQHLFIIQKHIIYMQQIQRSSKYFRRLVKKNQLLTQLFDHQTTLTTRQQQSMSLKKLQISVLINLQKFILCRPSQTTIRSINQPLISDQSPKYSFGLLFYHRISSSLAIIWYGLIFCLVLYIKLITDFLC